MNAVAIKAGKIIQYTFYRIKMASCRFIHLDIYMFMYLFQIMVFQCSIVSNTVIQFWKNFFATPHEQLIYEEGFVEKLNLKVRAVPSLKGHESEPQALSETVSNVCCVGIMNAG